MEKNEIIKNDKELHDYEYYDLKKKEKDNVPMTAEEAKKLDSYKKRDIVNTVLRILGLITAIFCFILIFDLFAEGTIWGFIFKNQDTIEFAKESGYTGNNTPGAFWHILYYNGSLKIFRAVIGDALGTAIFATIFFSVIHIGLSVLIMYLLAYSIKDIVMFLKKLFFSPFKLVKDVGSTTKESISLQEKEDKIFNGGKKKLFDDEVKSAEKKKPGPKKKNKPIIVESVEPQYTNEILDRMIKGESLAEIRKSQEEAAAKRKSEIAEITKTEEPKEEIIEESKYEENPFGLPETVKEIEEELNLKEEVVEEPTKSLNLDETPVEVHEEKTERRRETDFLENLRKIQKR